MCHEGSYLIGQIQTQQSSLVLDDGKAGLKVGGSNVCQQTPLETGAETIVQQCHFRGRTVRGQNNLTAGFVQSIEGMEEFVLYLFLTGNELHVVHQQQVCFAVLGAELAAAAGTDQFDELVDEVIALDVNDLGIGIVLADDVGDGIDQMGLAQTGITVD